MKKRKGMGKGMGEGWKNLLPNDSFRHGLASKGIKSVSPTKFFKEAPMYPKLDAKAPQRLVDLEEGDIDVETLMQIEAELKQKVESVDERETGIYSFETDDGEEWVVAVDLETAENLARERVQEDLEENPEYFNKDFIEGQIDLDNLKDQLEDDVNNMNWDYVNDIESESDSTYPNRLRAEMVERNLITEEDAEDEDFDIEEFKEDFVQEMTDEQLEDPMEYLRDIYGDDAPKEAIRIGGIDIDSAVDDAIMSDGWHHFVSGYDSDYTELDNGMVMWREN